MGFLSTHIQTKPKARKIEVSKVWNSVKKETKKKILWIRETKAREVS